MGGVLGKGKGIFVCLRLFAGTESKSLPLFVALVSFMDWAFVHGLMCSLCCWSNYGKRNSLYL